MDYKKLIEDGKFDVDKVIQIMKLINHQWMIYKTNEFRVPTKEEILDTINFLVLKVKECEDYAKGVVETPIESALGGIHVKCILSWKIGSEIPALVEKWEIGYVPVFGISYDV